MLTEAQQELHDAYKLMSAEELRGMLGDDGDTDAAINAILSNGKAVEVKGGTKDADEDGDGNERTHHSIGSDSQDDADEEEGEGASASADAEQSDADAADPAAAATEPAAEPEADTSALAPLDLGVVETRFKTAMDALKEEKAFKLQQMLDGEIEPAEYSQYESDYEDKRDALKEQKAGEAAWLGLIHDFKAQALKDTGINYDTDLEKGQAFDDWLKRLADNEANGHRDEAWFIAQAHKKVMAEFDIAPKAKAAEAPAAPAPRVPVKPTNRKPNLAAIPPSLGGLPAAADNEAGDAGEFAHLDNLTGMAYEKAIARLTPEQRDRWATGE